MVAPATAAKSGLAHPDLRKPEPAHGSEQGGQNASMSSSPASVLTSPPSAGGEATATAELQRQLAWLQQRVQELEQSQSELEAFVHSVAHELRTPLSAADTFCKLLQETLAPLSQDEVRSAEQYASRLRTGLQHMGELISALLMLSRASNTTLQGEPVILSALALEVLDGLGARAPQRAHRLEVQPGLSAWGDRVLLRQLLENLLGNAWKFSDRCAQVHIELGRQPMAQGGAFYVRDHGAGFDMAQAHRLFQPFERLHSTAEFAGTGIGLATVRRIVARHGGQVYAEASPGQGATFFFTLAGPEPVQPLPTP